MCDLTGSCVPLSMKGGPNVAMSLPCHLAIYDTSMVQAAYQRAAIAVQLLGQSPATTVRFLSLTEFQFCNREEDEVRSRLL